MQTETGAGEAKAGGKKQPSKEIKVEAVRGAVAFAQTTPAREAGKVVVLHPAERMNGIAANALLKTLEEPAGSARFILSCSAPEALLPTIRSRCQAFALTGDPALRSSLRFGASNAAYVSGGQVRYAEGRVDPATRARRNDTVSVAASDALTATLARAATPATRDGLAGFVASHTGAGGDEASAWVDALVEAVDAHAAG